VALAGWRVFRVYPRILRAPHAARLVAAMFVGRLPNGMFPLGIVFVLRGSSASYSATGAALAALMLGTTCSAPVRGRAVDRWGQSRTLIPFVLAQTAAMAGFLLAVATRQSMLLLIPFVTAVGATNATLGGSMRQLWPMLVRSPEDLPSAYAGQALLEDLIAVAGPLVASSLLAVGSPMSILVCAEIAALAGTIVFVTSASRFTAGILARRSGSPRALGTPGMRTLVLTLLAAGMVVGMLYIEVPAFVHSETAGILLAVMAASSMVSGLCYGARAWVVSVDRRYVRLAGVFAAAVALLVAVDSPAQLGVTLSLIGIVYAPRMISAYHLLDELAPRESVAEAYTWLVSASAGGVALGSAVAGPLVQHAGTRWAFAATGMCAVTGYVVVIVRRTTLRPGPCDVPAPSNLSTPGRDAS
jgi:MFS family permease